MMLKFLSADIYVELSKEELRPMDEYMGFVKKPPELLLDVEKTEGIKLGTCGAFFAFKPPQAKSNDLLPVTDLCLLTFASWSVFSYRENKYDIV
jgi:hypothetical protein